MEVAGEKPGLKVFYRDCHCVLNLCECPDREKGKHLVKRLPDLAWEDGHPWFMARPWFEEKIRDQYGTIAGDYRVRVPDWARERWILPEWIEFMI